MSSRLFVSNLSAAATLASLRALFGRCGEVLDVEFAAERSSRSLSTALITMASPAAAERAQRDLHGQLHCDRVLMVTAATGDTGQQTPGSKARARDQAAASAFKCALTQQYRDRHALTYELDCSGKRLTLRFIFPTDDVQVWQLEARINSDSTAVVGSAPLREQAFRAMVADWDSTAPGTSSQLDWEQVAVALRAVKALG